MCPVHACMHARVRACVHAEGGGAGCGASHLQRVLALPAGVQVALWGACSHLQEYGLVREHAPRCL